jgi:hypothetical protein
MKHLASNKSELDGGRCPQTPGVYRFSSPEWAIRRGRRRRPRLPFRLLNRSLGLLSSIALSRPAQVSSVSTALAPRATKLQRTVSCQIGNCLTDGSTPILAAASY